MRTTIEIPDSVFKEAKARAALSGETLKIFVARAVKRELSGERAAARRVSLPLFGKKGRAAKIVTNTQIEKALSEEEATHARAFARP